MIRLSHACNNACIYCRHIHDAASEEDWVHCQDCNRYLKHSTCFELYRRKTKADKSIREQYFRCTKCDQINMRLHKRNHECGEQYCKTCKDFVQDDHKCYMQPVERDNDTKDPYDRKFKYIYFDFECTQDNLLQCTKGINQIRTINASVATNPGVDRMNIHQTSVLHNEFVKRYYVRQCM